jgi:hypothetical protein
MDGGNHRRTHRSPSLPGSVVEDRVLLELKAVERLLPIARLPVSLLVNFNVVVLKSGLRQPTPEHSKISRPPDLPVPIPSESADAIA